ncbi:MAG: carbohydrate ABC transporter substrate-binding protein [Phycisphaerae bacterium]|nr:carbohydrate ABC transporter substrate-binding protein [Phycisphaerae bacterium]
MRHHSWIPCLVVLGVGVAGCRREAEPKAVLKFAHSVTSGASKPLYDAACAEFEALHPGIKVKQIVLDGSTYEKQGLQSMLQGGDAPDVFFEWAGHRVASKVRDGYAADLTAALDKDGWREEFDENAWHATTVDGRNYMIPNTIMVTVMHWYNPKILAKHDLVVPRTYEGLLETLKKLKAAGETPMLCGNRELWPLGNWGAHLIQRVVGARLYDDVLSLRPGTSFVNPGFVKSLEMIQQWSKLGLFSENVMATSDIDAQLGFINGKGALYAMGNWVISNAKTDAPPGFEYDGFNLPPMKDGQGDQTSIMALNTGYMVSKTTKHFDLAIAFLRHMMSESVQERMVGAGAISTIKSVFDPEKIDPHLRRCWDAWKNAKTILAPPDTGYRIDVANRLYDAIALVADGKADPKTALTKAEEQVAPWRQAAAGAKDKR